MTEHDLTRLRDAFAAEAPAAGECPDAGAIWDAVHSQLPAEETAAIVEHVASCGACAEAWRIARELAADTPAAVTPFPSRSRGAGRAALRGGLALAATVVLAVLGWRLLRPPAPAQQTQAEAPAPKPDQTLATAAPAIEKPPVTMSASRALVFRSGPADPFVAEFGEAIEPYRRDDYAEAAKRLEVLGRKYPDADEPPYYLGVSLLLSGKKAEAVAPLTRAAAGKDATIAAQARKYLEAARQ